MVCPRCITAVGQLLHRLSLPYSTLSLGKAKLLKNELTDDEQNALATGLEELGFELIDDRRSQLIADIKALIVQKVHHEEIADNRMNWSEVISTLLDQDYRNLSRLFSSVEGITIEAYIIRQRVEKVKELIIYDQLTFSEIAWKLGYSSVAHLSGQFKKVTGMSPSDFKLNGKSRKTIDQV